VQPALAFEDSLRGGTLNQSSEPEPTLLRRYFLANQGLGLAPGCQLPMAFPDHSDRYPIRATRYRRLLATSVIKSLALVLTASAPSVAGF